MELYDGMEIFDAIERASKLYSYGDYWILSQNNTQVGTYSDAEVRRLLKEGTWHLADKKPGKAEATFEAGQRWLGRGRCNQCVLIRKNGGEWVAVDRAGSWHYLQSDVLEGGRMCAPAPKPGQLWQLPNKGKEVVTDYKAGMIFDGMYWGTSVALAPYLLEQGAEYLGEVETDGVEPTRRSIKPEFEPGQRVCIWGTYIILDRYDECRAGWRTTQTTSIAFVVANTLNGGTVAAPAPKPGQRWRVRGEDAKIIDMGYGEIAVEPVAPGDIDARQWCCGSVVTVAEWLLAKGAEYERSGAVGQNTEKLKVELWDGMRLLNKTGNKATLRRRDSELWNVDWDDGHLMIYGDTEVRRSFEQGYWVAEEPPRDGRKPDNKPVTNAPQPPAADTYRRLADLAAKAERCTFHERAVLMAAVEHALVKREALLPLAALIAGCRAWERRRSEVAQHCAAKACRQCASLSDRQLEACALAAIDAAKAAGGIWPAWAHEVYERARAAC